MDLDQLRALVAIFDEGTMTGAAHALHMPQPTLSRSMQRLEHELGHRLFERSGRRIALTESGRAAVDWARQILRDERLMRGALESIARRERTLRIGTVAPAPLWRLTGLMMECLPRETLTSETLTQDEIIAMVGGGALDLGIVEGEDAAAALPDGVRSCALMRERLSVTLPPSHPLAAYTSLNARQLDGQTFLILTDIGFWRSRVEAALPHAVFIEQQDRTVFAQLMRTSPYCTFVTESQFFDRSTAGRVIVPLDDPMGRASFHLVARNDVSGTAADLFDWIEAHAR